MNIKILKEKIKNNECNNIFKELYKDEDISIRRYLNIIEGFENVFGEERDVNVFSAPGRTEIIGLQKSAISAKECSTYISSSAAASCPA